MRTKLSAGQIVLGAGISLSDPTVTEALAASVDFVWIDLEHNAITDRGYARALDRGPGWRSGIDCASSERLT